MKPTRLLFACIALLAVLFVAVAASGPAAKIHAAETTLPTYTWYDYGPDGLKMAFIPGPQSGSYTMIAGTQFYTVTSAGQPGPTPPTPPVPQPLTGLAKQVYDWATELGPKDIRAADAKALAKAMEATAAQIGAGAIKTKDEIIQATAAANRAAIGENRRTVWLPFFTKLMAYLDAESTAGRLTATDQYAAAWRDIAKGLEAVQ